MVNSAIVGDSLHIQRATTLMTGILVKIPRTGGKSTLVDRLPATTSYRLGIGGVPANLNDPTVFTSVWSTSHGEGVRCVRCNQALEISTETSLLVRVPNTLQDEDIDASVPMDEACRDEIEGYEGTEELP